MKIVLKRVLALSLAITLAFSVNVFADDPEKIDIGSDAIRKDLSNFVKTMYYEPRDRVNNISFYNGDYRLSSVKDYYVEYENNKEPGTAKVTYTGVGDYEGTYTATFTIAKMPISKITTKASFNSKKVLTVTASSGSEDLVLNKDYTYTSVTDVDGKVTVTIKGIGTRYTGTVKKTIKAKNNPNPSARSYLKVVTMTKCKNIKGKKIQLKWKKLKKITGYQINFVKGKSFSKGKKIAVGNNVKTYTLKKLKKKKTYSVRMRSYLIYNNKRYYSSWNTTVRVKIKK